MNRNWYGDGQVGFDTIARTHTAMRNVLLKGQKNRPILNQPVVVK